MIGNPESIRKALESADILGQYLDENNNWQIHLDITAYAQSIRAEQKQSDRERIATAVMEGFISNHYTGDDAKYFFSNEEQKSICKGCREWADALINALKQ